MCVVSAIGDEWTKTWPGKWPQVPPNPVYPIPEITRAEFEALRTEVLALKRLLKEAKKFDESTGQADCEMEQKIAVLRQIAGALGVDLSEVFPVTHKEAP